jgi:hypothetical protein
MKIQVSMTQEEKDKVLNFLRQNPCDVIDCRAVPCEACPFREVVEEYESITASFTAIIINAPTEVSND